MITDPSKLKHAESITELLRTIFGNDIQNGIQTLEFAGLTIEQIDKDLETGVQNGYSVEVQLKILSAVIRLIDK